MESVDEKGLRMRQTASLDEPNLGKSIQEEINAIPYWYHKIDLGNGIVTPGWAPIDSKAYRIPESLDGQTVLDVGAWDGYWTFEAAKRGACYSVAVDDFSDGVGLDVDRSNQWKSFDLCRKTLGLRGVVRLTDSVEYPRIWNAIQYDTIFCFGVLYHCKQPMRALANMRDACQGDIYIESAIMDHCVSAHLPDYVYSGAECVAEFMPGAEYGANNSNWWVPTHKCLVEMVKASGFDIVDAWKLTNKPKTVAHCRGFVHGRVPHRGGW